MKIVVIGKNGQVGQHLQRILGDRAVYLSRGELDLARVDSLYPALKALQADVIVNAGAYTDTKLAETEQGLAYAINAAAVAELARAAKAMSALFIHISTDYVFDGQKKTAYVEEDATQPMNVYGASKLLGEQLIQRINPQYFILRTSWIFSEYGDNFVKTIAKLATERQQLDIVADQVGCPTYAGHLALIIEAIITRYAQQAQASTSGVYHYADRPACSWYVFAQAIVEALADATAGVSQAKPPQQSLAAVNAIDSSRFPSPIQRPENGELVCQKLQDDFDLQRFNWRDILPQVIAHTI